MLGYGVPIYVNIPYPFEYRCTWDQCTHSTPETFTSPTHVPKHFNPVGSYRRKFFLPRAWPTNVWQSHGSLGGVADRREVYLVFEASGCSAMTVWLNGKEVGYSEDSKAPAEFKVSAYLRRGTNVLAVEVVRWSDGSYLEGQDMWRLSGITRRVYLQWRHAVHVRDVQISTDIIKDGEAGILSATAQMAFTRRAAAPAQAAPLEVEMVLNEMPPPPNLHGDGGRPPNANVPNATVQQLGREISRTTFVVNPRSKASAPEEPQSNSPLYGQSALQQAHDIINRGMGPRGAASKEARAAAPKLSHLYASSADATRGLFEDMTLPPVLVSSPKLWSAEAPHLYCLTIVLKERGRASASEATGGDKEVTPPLEVISIVVGFRSVRTAGGTLLLNERPLLIKGVNRHEHDPYTGHVVTREAMRQDVLQMKALHINAVRCSHYPNDPYFLYLADRHGLYVFDEANIESHGAGWANASLALRPDWLRAHMERTIAMVERDKNHPSVVTWSLGNEAGNGPNFHSTYNWIRARDATRLVQYERAIKDANQVEFNAAFWGNMDHNTDMIVPMYPYPHEIEYYALKNGSMPLVMCEFAHAMGNSLGGFSEYWRIIRRHASLSGGFIWDWKDQGIASRTLGGKPMWAYGGDFGPPGTPSDGIFCANGLTQPDGKLNPHAHEVAHVYTPLRIDAPTLTATAATLKLTSEMQFEPLQLRVTWRVLEQGVAVCTGSIAHDVVVPPRSEPPVTIQLDLANGRSVAEGRPTACGMVRPGREYHLDVDTHTAQAQPALPAAHLLAAVQFVLARPAAAAPAVAATPAVAAAHAAAASSSPSSARVKVDMSSKSAVRVTAGALEVLFNKTSGALAQLTWAGESLLLSELRPNFWRAPIDNDLGWQMPLKLRMWRAASQHKKQALLDHLRVLKGSGGDENGACLLSSWRVASSHLHSGRNRVLDLDGRGKAGLTALAREGSHCGKGSNQTCVSCLYTVASGSTPPPSAAGSPAATSLASTPSVGVECRYLPGDRMRAYMPNLPRFGMSASFKKQLDTLTWFGKGPVETYADRQSGARFGEFSASVASQLHPYLRPQESGNKVGVRSLWLTDADARKGVLVSVPRGRPPMSASAHHFLTADLDLATAEDAAIVSTHHTTRQREVQKHAAEMSERDLTQLNLDAAQMGVGGVHSWGAKPDPSVMLPPHHKYRLTFTLRPVSADAGARAGLREIAVAAAEADGAALVHGASPDAGFRCTFPGDEEKPFVPGGPRGRSAPTAVSAGDDGADESMGRTRRRKHGRGGGKRAGRSAKRAGAMAGAPGGAPGGSEAAATAVNA